VEQRLSRRHLSVCQTSARQFVLRRSGTQTLTHFPFRQGHNLLSRPGQQYTRAYAGTQCALLNCSETSPSQSGIRLMNPVVVFTMQ
jgi:hypothetical protein